MSARREEAYSVDIVYKNVLYRTCGHNKLCPYFVVFLYRIVYIINQGDIPPLAEKHLTTIPRITPRNQSSDKSATILRYMAYMWVRDM